MQVGVITDEISQDISEALDVMQRVGVGVSEIRAVWGKNSVDLDDDELKRLKTILKARGSTVCGIASPFYKCDLFSDRAADRGPMHDAREVTIDEQLALLEKCFQVAETLDTNFIRVFSFWRASDPTPEIEQAIVEQFQKPAELAERRGMVLLLENEHSCFLGTGVETARVLKQLDSKAVQAVWDPGNALCGGETPFPGGYEALSPWIKHIHIKDGIRQPDGTVKFVKVGEGEVGYDQHIRRLKQDGYNGYLSLETHYSLDKGGKAAASEESLIAITEFVRNS